MKRIFRNAQLALLVCGILTLPLGSAFAQHNSPAWEDLKVSLECKDKWQGLKVSRGDLFYFTEDADGNVEAYQHSIAEPAIIAACEFVRPDSLVDELRFLNWLYEKADTPEEARALK